MATINQVVGGLKIFTKYTGDMVDICAQHDVIYAGRDAASSLTPEDIAELENLEWFLGDEGDGAWAIFV